MSKQHRFEIFLLHYLGHVKNQTPIPHVSYISQSDVVCFYLCSLKKLPRSPFFQRGDNRKGRDRLHQPVLCHAKVDTIALHLGPKRDVQKRIICLYSSQSKFIKYYKCKIVFISSTVNSPYGTSRY